ncbi:MAG: beta-ketoacyl-[acyl-carrier-protein] synthase family protein [Thermoanaerobaculia bacterium]
MPHRVAITGLGIVSCLGHDYATVMARLRRGESGIRAMPEWAELKLTSLVAGPIEGLDDRLATAEIPKRMRGASTRAAVFCSLAALDAVADAGLSTEELDRRRIACLVGNSSPDGAAIHQASELIRGGRTRRVNPYTCYRSMGSGTSAIVANLLGVHGPSYSISSACSTSTHNIGNAFEMVRAGVVDGAVAGGGDDVSELIAGTFQALRVALSTRHNDTPQTASRPYDADRDGFVLSGGAGVVVLESWEIAEARGAHIHAELAGYAANSDGHGLVLPEPEGRYGAECVRQALADAGVELSELGYVNTHGTSTVAGDASEVKALGAVFGDAVPPFSSTKSMTGHALGAAGAHELIYTVGMLEGGFLAPSINIENRDPEFAGLPIVTETVERQVETALSLNFGFGGTNAVLVARRVS